MLFSSYFNLANNPDGYEFFNIDVSRDSKRFIDPYLIQRDKSSLGLQMTACLVGFMSQVLATVKNNQRGECFKLCNHFQETKGTMLGYSKLSRDGRGAGDEKCKRFVDSLFESKAVTNGIVKHLEECGLVCDGLDKDGISDITIAITRKELIEFTQNICRKYNIPMKNTKERLHYYCVTSNRWLSDYFELPHVINSKNHNKEYIILIPNHLIPEKMTYSYKYFYTNVAMNYFREQALLENHASVKRLKDGSFKVLAKELRLDSRFQGHKHKMAEFINAHSQSLVDYRSQVADYIYKSQT